MQPEDKQRDGYEVVVVPPPQMPKDKKPSRLPWLLAMALLLAGGVAVYYFLAAPALRMAQIDAPETVAPAPAVQATAPPSAGLVPPPPPPSQGGQVVQLSPEAGSSADQERAQRKKPFGLSESVDIVVRSDETIQIGPKRVPVEELERKLAVQGRGELLEKPLGETGEVEAWGIHLVRNKENLWNIHYELLREYLKKRGYELGHGADEPDPEGYSSGVGRVLKFAEHMVGVYNLGTGRMSSDLDTLEPGQKMVVFNLSEIFQELAKLDPEELQRVRFDGRVLFFPKPLDGAPATD